MHHEGERSVGGEYELAGQQPVRNAAGGVDVGPSVERRSTQRLRGSDEGRCPMDDVVERQSDAGLCGILSGLHDSKIEDLHKVVILAVAAEKNVCRFDVPMNKTS